MTTSLGEYTPQTIEILEDLPAASVVLAHGASGTAYQKFFSDGLFYGANREILTVAQMAKQPNLILIYRPVTTTPATARRTQARRVELARKGVRLSVDDIRVMTAAEIAEWKDAYQGPNKPREDQS